MLFFIFLKPKIDLCIPFYEGQIAWFDFIKLVIPVLLFFAGLYFSRLVDTFKENKRLKELTQFIVDTARVLVWSTDQQIRANIKHARECKNKNYDGFRLGTTESHKTLLEFGKVDLYKVFTKVLKGIDNPHITFDTFMYRVEHIAYVLNDFAPLYSNFIKRLDETILSENELYEKLRDELRNQTTQEINSKLPIDYKRQIAQILDKYHIEQEKSMKENGKVDNAKFLVVPIIDLNESGKIKSFKESMKLFLIAVKIEEKIALKQYWVDKYIEGLIQKTHSLNRSMVSLSNQIAHLKW